MIGRVDFEPCAIEVIAGTFRTATRFILTVDGLEIPFVDSAVWSPARFNADKSRLTRQVSIPRPFNRMTDWEVDERWFSIVSRVIPVARIVFPIVVRETNIGPVGYSGIAYGVRNPGLILIVRVERCHLFN